MTRIPHSDEAEAATLGCCLLAPNLTAELDPTWFHDVRHARIAEALISMATQGRPVTESSLVTFLGAKAQECGGASYIASLPEKTPSVHQWPEWRKELIGLASLRRLQAICSEFGDKCQDPSLNPQDTLDAFESEAFKLRLEDAGGEACGMQGLIAANIDTMEMAAKFPGRLRGLATGFRELDRMTGGIRPGWLVVLAGRPGAGKTALGLNVVLHTALAGIPVGICSMEMTKQELAMRLQCSLARVSQQRAERGELTESELVAIGKAGVTLARAPIYIDDTGGMTCARIASKARRMAQQHGIKLLVIDYLQLLHGSNPKASRYESVTEQSSAMKVLAKELGIPVLCLAQLNRSNEQGDRPPRPSDLRDSGQIEQDADIILLLHEQEGQNLLYLGKNRHGPAGKIHLHFNKDCTLFEEVEQYNKAA